MLTWRDPAADRARLAARCAVSVLRQRRSAGTLPGRGNALQQLEKVLAIRFGLRGLFGVDGIWHEGSFWPVEVNPRYTASVEVLEFATGLRALAWHASAFDPTVKVESESTTGQVVGKAILFARRTINDPANRLRKLPGEADVYCQRRECWPMPAIADIPAPGEQVQERQPVLSLFTEAADSETCEESLRRTAEELDQVLFCALTMPLRINPAVPRRQIASHLQ